MSAIKLNALIVAAACVFPGCTCEKETVREPADPSTTTVVEQPAPAPTPAPASTVIVQQPAATTPPPPPATTVNVNH